jgi:hypothetical protein
MRFSGSSATWPSPCRADRGCAFAQGFEPSAPRTPGRVRRSPAAPRSGARGGDADNPERQVGRRRPEDNTPRSRVQGRRIAAGIEEQSAPGVGDEELTADGTARIGSVSRCRFALLPMMTPSSPPTAPEPPRESITAAGSGKHPRARGSARPPRGSRRRGRRPDRPGPGIVADGLEGVHEHLGGADLVPVTEVRRAGRCAPGRGVRQDAVAGGRRVVILRPTVRAGIEARPERGPTWNLMPGPAVYQGCGLAYGADDGGASARRARTGNS